MAKDNTTQTQAAPGDFQALLQQPADQFEAPKPIPAGSFVHTITGFKFDKTTGEKKTPYVEFALKVNEPLPDVNEEALAAWLGDESLGNKTVRGQTYYLTPDAMYRLGEFLCDHCGVEKGIPTAEQIQQAVGHQFVGVYEQKPNPKDPSKVFSNITSTGPVPA